MTEPSHRAGLVRRFFVEVRTEEGAIIRRTGPFQGRQLDAQFCAEVGAADRHNRLRPAAGPGRQVVSKVLLKTEVEA